MRGHMWLNKVASVLGPVISQFNKEKLPVMITLKCFCFIFATQSQNLEFKLIKKGSSKKFLYECRAYQSVDDGSLSLVKSRKNMKKLCI